MPEPLARPAADPDAYRPRMARFSAGRVAAGIVSHLWMNMPELLC